MSSGGNEPPVVVVGGGIVGLATAFELRRAGLPVLVLERGEPAGGASSGNAGSISPGSVAPVAYPGLVRDLPGMLTQRDGPLRVTPRGAVAGAGWLVRFLLASRPDEVRRSAQAIAPLLSTTLDAHRDLAREVGASHLVQSTGQLQLYPDRKAYGKDAFGWGLRRELGVEFHELRREELLQYEPEIGPAYGFGVFLPNAGMVVDPGAYGRAVAEALVRSGGEIVRDEAVGFVMGDARITAVRTRAGEYRCGAVVMCAGAWSTRLLHPLGYRIPLINQRGYHLEFAEPGTSPRRVVVAADRKLFMTRMSGGLRVAGTVEIAPLDSPPDPVRARALQAGAAAVFPNLLTSRVREWSGERPCLPDSLPVMGRGSRHANLWFNFGHGHLGLTLSAATGQVIARSVASGRASPELDAFRPDRFGPWLRRPGG